MWQKAMVESASKLCNHLQILHNNVLFVAYVVHVSSPTHFFLCHRRHYKEYLVGKINQRNLDPVTLYETEQVKAIMRREELAIPEKEAEETEEQYRERLIKVRKLP